MMQQILEARLQRIEALARDTTRRVLALDVHPLDVIANLNEIEALAAKGKKP